MIFIFAFANKDLRVGMQTGQERAQRLICITESIHNPGQAACQAGQSTSRLWSVWGFRGKQYFPASTHKTKAG
jgi:hypothetical protein